MSLLKEGLKRGGIALSAGILATACGQNNTETNLSLVDCDKGPQSNSITIFLKEGQQVNIVGQPIKASSRHGGFEMVHSESINRPNAIQIDPDKNISFKPTRNSAIFPHRHDVYTVSGKAAINDGISGTELTIKADCETPQTKP